MTNRYVAKRQATRIMIVDRKTGDAIGYVHSAPVAEQVVAELNSMERA